MEQPQLTTSKTPDRRKSDTVAKNKAKKALAEYLPVYQGRNLEFNPVITAPIRESLGLTIRDEIPTSIGRPGSAPLAWLELRGPCILALHYKFEGAEGKARPSGYGGVLIRYGVFDSSEPAPRDWEDLRKVRIGTDTPEVFEFPPELRGKKAYFALAWINSKGEMGPFTEILVELIP